MEQRRGLRGCLALLVLLLLLGGIYFYLFRETEESTPAPTAPLRTVE